MLHPLSYGRTAQVLARGQSGVHSGSLPCRAKGSAIEWECQTLELLAARDPAVLDLRTGPRLSLPRTLPDGVYVPSPRR